MTDGHNDFMILVRALYGDHIYNSSFTKPFEDGRLLGHVDAPRLREGLVGGAFWSAFIGCPANVTDFSDTNYAGVVRATMQQLDLFHRLSSVYPHFFTPPPNSKNALSAFKKYGRLISPIGIEGLHQIGNSPATLRLYHSLGVRYATLTWNCHNVYADAAVTPDESGRTGISKPLWHGVSERGRELIYEMNRLGMMIDLAHVSQNTMRDALIGSTKWGGWKGSVAPPIFSHSSAYAICPHPRNVPDDVLQLVKQRGSLVMINFSADFISCTPSNSSSGLPITYAPNVTLAQVVRHIRHIGELIGYDYVGLGSDFDGIEAAPRGLEDVSKFPSLVAELLQQGVSEHNVINIIGGNLLRVWRQADAVSAKMRVTTPPLEDEIKPYR
jgi:membrane dipeptidase